MPEADCRIDETSRRTIELRDILHPNLAGASNVSILGLAMLRLAENP